MSVDICKVMGDLAQAVARDPAQPLPLRLCHACVELLDMDGGSIYLGRQPQRMLMCATDPESFRLERAQELLGEGPVIDAYGSGQPVTATLRPDARDPWPMLGTAAVEIFGTVTLYALPMRTPEGVLGVLTVHSRGQRPVADELSTAVVLADIVGAALVREAESHGLDTWGPWAERAAIDQATGVVIAQLGIPPEDAHAMLRAHAYAHDTTVAAIAADVLARRLDLREPDAPNG